MKQYKPNHKCKIFKIDSCKIKFYIHYDLIFASVISIYFPYSDSAPFAKCNHNTADKGLEKLIQHAIKIK